MSRKIYLLRHGKPNIEGKRCIGLTDVPLSSEGERQAEKIGKWISKLGIKKIYTSPLFRCQKTASIIKKAIQTTIQAKSIYIDISTIDDLREMSVGQWENLTFQKIKERFPEEYKKRGENIGYYAPPEGESFDEAGKRFEKCINAIRKETKGNILIIAHAGVIRSYLCRLCHLSANEVLNFPQPYCGLTLLEEKKEQETQELEIIKIGWKPYSLLEKEEIKELYRECETPEKVISHMEAVADFLEKLKHHLPEKVQNQYNWDLLNKAALLHDVKRTEKNHAKTGAEFLVKAGYPELGELIRYHHDSNISNKELSAEEILFYADKRVLEDKVVSLEERFEHSKKKCILPEAIEKHKKLYEKSKLIEMKIEMLLFTLCYS